MKIHLFERSFVGRTRFISVIDRIIASDIVKTLLTVISVLVLIIATRQFLRILRKAIEGEISGETIMTLLGLKIIGTVAILIPSAIFLSVLMVLGRMYRDNEMTILAVSGAGIFRIFRAVLVVVIPLSIFIASLSLVILPWSVQKTKEIMNIEKQTANIRGISAGKFSEYSRGDIVFYVEELTDANKMRNVFVQNRQHGKLGIINSEGGYVREDVSGNSYIVLENGYRYQGLPGTTDYSVTKFGEYGVRVDQRVKTVATPREATSSIALLLSPLAADQAELQKRISIPLGALFLSLLAVPLARIAPRGGIYGNFLTAFLIYFSYENLVQAAQIWIVNGLVPPWIGIWWVYILMLFVILVLIIRALGFEWVARTFNKKTLH